MTQRELHGARDEPACADENAVGEALAGSDVILAIGAIVSLALGVPRAISVFGIAPWG